MRNGEIPKKVRHRVFHSIQDVLHPYRGSLAMPLEHAAKEALKQYGEIESEMEQLSDAGYEHFFKCQDEQVLDFLVDRLGGLLGDERDPRPRRLPSAAHQPAADARAPTARRRRRSRPASRPHCGDAA